MEQLKGMRYVLGRLYAMKGFFRNEDITERIKHVSLIDNKTVSNYILLPGKPAVHINCIIYLDDDRELFLNTKDVKVINKLMEHMKVFPKRRRIK